MQKLAWLIALSALLASPAYAYVGPGAGAGVIAVVFGVIVSILLAIVGIVWYPLKRLLRGRKAAQKKTEVV